VLPPERRPALHEKLGRDLGPEVWDLHMTGHRLLIAPEPVSDRMGSGLLYKVRSQKDREALEMGAGWIIGAGPLAGFMGEGAGAQAYPVGLLLRRGTEDPTSPGVLLGLHVLYRQYSGINLKTNAEDAEFGGTHSLIVLPTRDILAWELGV
jgi:hypothetical protein